jgi:RNA polymerase sigma factor (sigma-70 family)
MEIQRQSTSLSPKDAKDLHRRCCSDEPHEYNAAFQQLGQYLLRVAYSQISGQPQLAYIAEDCSQQALVTIWKKLREGNGPNHVEWFLTWCAGIVIHKVLDELRKLARTSAGSLEELLANGHEPPAQYASGNASTVDAYYLVSEDKVELVEMIQRHPRLSEEAKFVLLHGYLLEKNDEELARQLGKTRSTIRVLRFRGLTLLRNDKEFMAKATMLATVA